MAPHVSVRRCVAGGVVAVACLCGAAYVWSRPLATPDWRDWLGRGTRAPLSLVLSADPGDMIGGFSEAALLLEVAVDLVPLDTVAEELYCPTAYLGEIGGNAALIATTGIGATRAALCLDSLLRKFGARTREVMFLGTAGGSPAIGGLLDSADCGRARAPEPARVARLGDVCVSPFATNWDCQRCFWADEPYRKPAPGEAPFAVTRERNACARAPCSLHTRWDLFGDFGCSYYAETALADEVLAAARAAPPPTTPRRLAAYEAAFWDATAAARGAEGWGAAHAAAVGARPGATYLGYDVCAEATSMTYFKGAPYDELARSYVADLLADADAGLGLASPGAPRPTKSDVLAVSAMEGTGWMSVLKQSEVYLKFAHIPRVAPRPTGRRRSGAPGHRATATAGRAFPPPRRSANIRGIADYTHDPLVRYGDEVWLEDADWVDEGERMNYTVAGYRYAIQTTSAAVIALFDARARAPSPPR